MGAPTVRPVSGVSVWLRPGGFVYQARGEGWVAVRSAGLRLGRGEHRSGGVVAPSPVGPVSVVVRGGSAEVLQRVDRRLGMRAWRWRLESLVRRAELVYTP